MEYLNVLVFYYNVLLKLAQVLLKNELSKDLLLIFLVST